MFGSPRLKVKARQSHGQNNDHPTADHPWHLKKRESRGVKMDCLSMTDMLFHVCNIYIEIENNQILQSIDFMVEKCLMICLSHDLQNFVSFPHPYY